MRVLVTGAGGFVGYYLCSYLQVQGNTVWGTDKHQRDLENYFTGEILDKEFIKGVVQEVKPELVFHLAGFSSVKKSFAEAELTQQVNVEGTRNIVSALQEIVPQSRLLYVSSAVIYGVPGKAFISEDEPVQPNSPYAQSRVDAERMLQDYQLPWIIARSFNHTGPGQNEEFVLSDWCRQAAAIELGLQAPIINVGNIESVRDFMDVRDIVKMYYQLILHGQVHTVYNVGSGTGYRLGDLLDKIISFAAVPVQILIDEKKVRSQDTTLLVADIGKLSNILGPFTPEYSIDRTLRDILDYWRQKLKG